jgi:hypothetical protein
VVLQLDPALIISLVALGASLITLWLTELRGPNINLVNNPKFMINDSSFTYLDSSNFTPKWFSCEPVSFLFANYGGKDGTILDLRVDFIPRTSFKAFNLFSANIQSYSSEVEASSLPITIKEGSNRYLKFSPRIETIDWKQRALVEALKPNLKISEIVELALDKSKDNFRSFCDFLNENRELGTVNCFVTFTKGRFNPKLRDQKIHKNFVIKNECKESLTQLRNCLLKWDELSATRAEMEQKLLQDTKELTKEIQNILYNASNVIDEHQVAQNGLSRKLLLDNWVRLRNIKDNDEIKIRWFLIKTDSNLEKQLLVFYESALEFNRLLDSLIVLGETRSLKDFIEINVLREKIKENAYKKMDELRDLQRKFV